MYNPLANPNTEKQLTNLSQPIGNLPPQFELDEFEEEIHNSIKKWEADENPFSFIRRKDTNATIFRVNHLRVSIEEAKKIKDFMFVNIHKGHKEFIIDLSICEFMDSTFLGAIILAAKKLIKEDGKIVLVALPEKLKVLHALKELNKILHITSSLDEAVEEMKQL